VYFVCFALDHKLKPCVKQFANIFSILRPSNKHARMRDNWLEHYVTLSVNVQHHYTRATGPRTCRSLNAP